jgi:dUTP pyrophosphatase
MLEIAKLGIKTKEGVSIPVYETKGAAGFDLTANSFLKLFNGKKEIDLENTLTHSLAQGYLNLRPSERVLIGTGIFVAIPEGYQLEIRSRSGQALKKGLVVLNQPGTIDSDYRGEVGVILFNSNEHLVKVELGERIAQGVLMPALQAEFILVDELSDTERGQGGFGSTGEK